MSPKWQAVWLPGTIYQGALCNTRSPGFSKEAPVGISSIVTWRDWRISWKVKSPLKEVEWTSGSVLSLRKMNPRSSLSLVYLFPRYGLLGKVMALGYKGCRMQKSFKKEEMSFTFQYKNTFHQISSSQNVVCGCLGGLMFLSASLEDHNYFSKNTETSLDLFIVLTLHW